MPDLFNLYINFLSVTSFVAFSKKKKKKKKKKKRKKKKKKKQYGNKNIRRSLHCISYHMSFSNFSSSSPISLQYGSNTINITVQLLKGSLQFVVYCKVEMWWKASIVGGRREREREREVQKTREEKLTFYDLHNLRTARYKAYLSVLEVQEVLQRMYL